MDSLWGVWNDSTQPDSSRLKALDEYAWSGYLYTQPDSAFFYAQLQYELAREKGLKKQMATALNTQGVSLQLQGDYIKAIKFHNRNLRIRQEIDDKRGIAIALNNIGMIYEEQGGNAKAIDFLTRSLKIAEEIDDKPAIANSLNNIGNVYKSQGDYNKAIDYYTRSLTIYEEIGDKNGISYSLGNLGIIYDSKSSYAKAIEYYSRSLKIQEEIGNNPGVGRSLNNIGVMYKDQADSAYNAGDTALATDSYLSAMEYYTRSLEIKEDLEDKRGIAASLSNIGTIYIALGENADAMDYLTRALRISQKVGALEETSGAARSLWELYKKLGRYKEAITMYELYITTLDSIQSEENQKEVIRQEYKYAYEKQALQDSIKAAEETKLTNAELARKNAESKRQKAEIQAQRNQQYALYGGVGLLLIFGGFMYNRFRVTRKQKSIIEEQKDEVELQRTEAEKQRDFAQKEHQEAEKQRHIVEEKNTEIMDSINYAKRLQDAILPPLDQVKSNFPQSFVLFKPKDIVSGDFYWMETISRPINTVTTKIQNSPPKLGGVDAEGGRGGQQTIMNKPELKYFRKKLRSDLTPAEAKLWKYLSKSQLEGRKFRRQHSIGNYIVDFYCPTEKLAIELDGSVHNDINADEYDQERELILKEFGVKVIRFENKDVFEDPDQILETIKSNFGWFEKEGLPPRPQKADTPPSQGGEPVEWIYFAAADCTGHGVPGAMVSVVCANALNKAVNELGKTDPAEILDTTRELVIATFAKAGEDVKDGMDISLVALRSRRENENESDPDSHSVLQWAGANNPLWILRKTSPPVISTGADKGGVVEKSGLSEGYQLIEIKADKQPIGLYGELKPFTSHSVKLNSGDSIYIFSDGYPDQFGGKKGKKYKSGKMKRFLLSIQDKPMQEQQEILNQEFESWRGDLEQVDDICVIGVRV